MKTSNLSGVTLDWAVAKCEEVDPQFERDSHGRIWQGWTIADPVYRRMPQYSTNWEQSGPIIERENIDIHSPRPHWKMCIAYIPSWAAGCGMFETFKGYGETKLIAAMRCYVASKLGDEIDIPEELK